MSETKWEILEKQRLDNEARSKAATEILQKAILAELIEIRKLLAQPQPKGKK